MGHDLLAQPAGVWTEDGLATCRRSGGENGASSRAAHSTARLTEGQIACLLLVDEHLTSKEIGLRLGISNHTVDQRVRRALRVLGCGTRRDAAKLVGQEFAPPSAAQREAPEQDLARLPFATRRAPSNNLSTRARLMWVVVIAAGSALSVAVYLAGLESLARLLGPN
jgi:DNA-binding CsgD family transcriptional regulator